MFDVYGVTPKGAKWTKPPASRPPSEKGEYRIKPLNKWFIDADAVDRTRMLGRLDMLYEMTLDLAEENEELAEGE